MAYVIQVLLFTVKTLDDGQMNCPKHVEFYSKNKFEKLVHVVGFVIRKDVHIYCYIFLCLARYSQISLF